MLAASVRNAAALRTRLSTLSPRAIRHRHHHRHRNPPVSQLARAFSTVTPPPSPLSAGSTASADTSAASAGASPDAGPSPDPAPTLDAPLSLTALLANTGAEYLQWFHAAVSLDGALFPIAPSLMLSALALRALTLPLVYYNQVHAGRAALAAKELPRIQAFVRRTPGTLLQKYLTFRRLRALTFRSAGTAGWKVFRWHLLLHLPLVMSASLGVREWAAAAPEAWRQGGVAWFPDLTVADPTGALPIMTTALWVWNLDPRSGAAAREGRGNKGAAEVKESKEGDTAGARLKNASMERIMSSRGQWLTTLLQVCAVASLTFTLDAPCGLLVLWASNGAVTAVQRGLLSADGVRRAIGLLTVEDLRQASGPPVLEGTKAAVEKVRRELEYVQREVLTRFPSGKVDERVEREVNRMLERERWSGRISMQLEAVMREDEKDGKKYIAVVRKGSA